MIELAVTLLLAICVWCAAFSADGAVLSRLKQGESLTISAIGTSVTGDYHDPDAQVGRQSTWLSQTGEWLNKLYPGKISVHNEGIGGAASKYTATYTKPGSGLDVQLGRALAHNPDVIFIEFAINDAYGPYGISRQMSKDNLQAMIDQINTWAADHHKTVDIVIQTMNNVTDRHPTPDLAGYYQGYRDVAATNKLLLIDHYPNWVALYNSEADHAKWNSYVNAGVHPNDLGAQYVIVPEIQRALIGQLPKPTALPLARMPLLMPDDFSEMNLVTWRVERGQPDPNNPLIEGDMPWDCGGVGIHGSVFKDPIDLMWKAYLVCTPAGFFPREDPWKSDNSAYRRVCLFESTDGVHWTRSELSNVSIGDHAKTNAIFDIDEGVSAYPSVLIDPQDRQWPYTMIVLREAQDGSPADGPPPQGKGNGYYRYRSKDGKAWELLGKVEGPMKGDVAFFYRNPEGGYVCYHRVEGTRQPNDHVPVYEYCARRTCYRATSQDGNRWVTDPEMVMTADERDHRDTQYQECVPLKVDGGFLGMITMYHPITQTLNLRMAASRDGRHWWFPDRVPCLDNAPLGEYGGGMIWQSQNLIIQDKRLYVYYGGTEGVHRQISDTRAPSIRIGPMETVVNEPDYFLPFNAALCRAAWRIDRMYALVSSAGGPTIGTAVTAPREIGGTSLWVNVQTRPPKKSATPGFDEGCLQVELLDKDGKPLPGFTQTDCIPLKGDHDAIQVKWAGGDKAPQNAQKAKFYLKRAFLYGFEFRGEKGG